MTIHDISLSISESLVVWSGDPPVALVTEAHLDRGDIFTLTRLQMSAHTGTHVDAPAHFVPGGPGIETLDLEVLVGPALLVDVSQAETLSAAVLESLAIPPGTTRVLFRTRNSDRGLLQDPNFHEDFVGIEADAASWLVEHGIKLVGVDYLSVAPFSDLVTTHQVLLGAGIIPLEGLVLNGLAPGIYQFVCLPIKISGCDGAPARAILIS